MYDDDIMLYRCTTLTPWRLKKEEEEEEEDEYDVEQFWLPTISGCPV